MVQVATQMEIAFGGEFLFHAICRPRKFLFPQAFVGLFPRKLKFVSEEGPASPGERKLAFEAFVDKNWRREEG